MRLSLFIALVVGAASMLGCDGSIGDTGPAVAPDPAPPFDPQPGRLRRLTQGQYERAIRDVFGDDLDAPPGLPDDQRTLGLVEIGNASGTVSPRGSEQYEEAAYLTARQVAERFDTSACDPADEVCFRAYLREMGRALWRRPLHRDELDELIAIAEAARAAAVEPNAGIVYALATMLQSPYFLYRSERGELLEGEAHRSLDDWELASRLSFFLWNTGPDAELLDAAARGDLRRETRLRAQVLRMLDDERAREGVRAIFADIFELDRLDSLRKDPTVYPHMSPELGPSAREETLRVAEWLTFDEPQPYHALFTTRTSFINRKLASVYNVRAPSRDDFGRVEFSAESMRSGILGHASIAALHSHVSSSSATLRGIFVRRTLLCGEILPPPANVDTSIPEPIIGAATLRDRVARHLEDASCAGCHRRMDPLGLGLENFDGVGRYRVFDNGQYINPAGDVDGVFFANPNEFGEVLSRSDDAMRCAARWFYRYAHGVRDDNFEREAIDEIYSEFRGSDYRVLTLLEAVATHPSFRLIGEAEETP